MLPEGVSSTTRKRALRARAKTWSLVKLSHYKLVGSVKYCSRLKDMYIKIYTICHAVFVIFAELMVMLSFRVGRLVGFLLIGSVVFSLSNDC